MLPATASAVAGAAHCFLLMEDRIRCRYLASESAIAGLFRTGSRLPGASGLKPGAGRPKPAAETIARVKKAPLAGRGLNALQASGMLCLAMGRDAWPRPVRRTLAILRGMPQKKKEGRNMAPAFLVLVRLIVLEVGGPFRWHHPGHPRCGQFLGIEGAGMVNVQGRKARLE